MRINLYGNCFPENVYARIVNYKIALTYKVVILKKAIAEETSVQMIVCVCYVITFSNDTTGLKLYCFTM